MTDTSSTVTKTPDGWKCCFPFSEDPEIWENHRALAECGAVDALVALGVGKKSRDVA